MWRKLKTESEDLVHYSNQTLTETYVYDKAVACNTQSNSLLTAELSLTFLLASIIDFLVITENYFMAHDGGVLMILRPCICNRYSKEMMSKILTQI